MDYDWLKDFLALAEHGTFSRAADARHVTQPAFSRRIRALEDWMGTRLFERSAQGALPTPAGHAFLELAQALLRQLDRARETVQEVGAGASGSLSIAATHALSFSFFPGFIRQHLDLEGLGPVNLVSDSQQACEQLLLAGEVQFLLCHHREGTASPLAPDRFESIAVGCDTLVPLSAPDDAGKPLWTFPAIVSGQPTRLLGYSPASGLGRILASHHVSEVGSVERPFTSHLAATLLTMAREGHGAAWLPLTLAQDDLDCGRLVRAGSRDHDVDVEIRIFRGTEHRNGVGDALWERLTRRP